MEIIDYDNIEHEGKKYPVKYRRDKQFSYASTIIDGNKIEGRGDTDDWAYQDLGMKLHIHTNFRLGV